MIPREIRGAPLYVDLVILEVLREFFTHLEEKQSSSSSSQGCY